MFSSNGFAACLSAVVICAASYAMFSTAGPDRSAEAVSAPPVSSLTTKPAVIAREASQSPARAPVAGRPIPSAAATISGPLSINEVPVVQPADSGGGMSVRDDISVGATAPSHLRTPEPTGDRVPRLMYCHPGDRGPFRAADVLQDCLDRAPAFSSVEIPAGTYILHRQVVVSRPVTIRTAGSADTSLSCSATPDHCAVLMAAPDMVDRYGVLLVHSTGNVMLEHVVIDGNRTARLSSAAAQWCQAGRTASGFNATVVGCVRCALNDVVSKNALCGTGMVWSGAQAVIRRSEFRDNGDATTARMWADGLTVLYAPESDIRENRFVDNSDIGLILGHAARSRIEGNVVVQQTQPAFAGLMLDNFNSNNLSMRGDFRGAVIANNIVDCGAQLCVFGIQVGPGPWYPARNIVGGELHSNDVRGAKVGINVDGAGVRLIPTAVYANRVSRVPGRTYFSDCRTRIPTEWMNVSPTSVVDRRNELTPTGSYLSEPCQLWSDLESDVPQR